MYITPAGCNYNKPYMKKPTQAPAFGAIKVDDLKVIHQAGNVQFFNNETIMFKEPMPFFNGLEELHGAVEKNAQRLPWGMICLTGPNIEKLRSAMEKLDVQKFKDREIYGITGVGADIVALKLDKGEVLCLTSGLNTRFGTREVEDFDLPILEKGKIQRDNYLDGWFISPFAEPVTKEELNELRNKIIKKGYLVYDWRAGQAGRLGSNIHLIDFECAIKN